MSLLALSYCPSKVVLGVTSWGDEHVLLLMEKNIMVSGAPSGLPVPPFCNLFIHSALGANIYSMTYTQAMYLTARQCSADAVGFADINKIKSKQLGV